MISYFLFYNENVTQKKLYSQNYKGEIFSNYTICY